MSKKIPSARLIQSWQDSIADQGNKRIKMRALLAAFGAQRRGAEIVRGIDEYLAGLVSEAGASTPLFVDWDAAPDLDSAVLLTPEKQYRIGRLWDGGENALQRDYGARIASKLGLVDLQAEYSPKGTRDRLDFLARDKKTNDWVVVEVKVQCGQKRAVEQLERYIDFIRREQDTEAVRGVLITGLGDANTKAALRTLRRPDLITWYLYGFQDDAFKLKKQQ